MPLLYRFGKRSSEIEDKYIKRGIDEVIRPRYKKRENLSISIS